MENDKNRILFYVKMTHPPGGESKLTKLLRKLYDKMLDELYLPFKEWNVKVLYHDTFPFKVGEQGKREKAMQDACKKEFPTFYDFAKKLDARIEKTEDFWPVVACLICSKHLYDKLHLIEIRDKRIAKNIDRTLKNGEVGALFMGAAHNVPRYLEGYKDIEVYNLRLLFGEQNIDQVILGELLALEELLGDVTHQFLVTKEMLTKKDALRLIETKPKIAIEKNLLNYKLRVELEQILGSPGRDLNP